MVRTQPGGSKELRLFSDHDRSVYSHETTAQAVAHFEYLSPHPLIIYRAVQKRNTVVDFTFEFCNPAAAVLFGKTVVELRGASLLRSFPHLAHDPGEFARYAMVVEKGNVEQADVPHPLGVPQWILRRRIIGLLDGRLAVSYRDLRPEKRARDQLVLSVQAAQQRLRRQLALVQAICNHTLHIAGSLNEFKFSFPGRIAALAEVEGLIQEQSDRILLADLLGKVLAPFHRCKRSLEGDGSVAISASAVLPLAIALHELGTNCVTRGSWSTPAGKVCLQWQTTKRSLRMEWSERECDGHPRPEASNGAELVLVENAIRSLANGRFEVRRDAGRIDHVMEFDPAG